MSGTSPACLEALAAIEKDPLALPPAVEAHLKVCTACSETRVNWLALEDMPPAQAPAGYFEHLPDRILMKLPAKVALRHRQPILWALAAALLAAVGVGGFILGRANKQPLVEASLAPAPQEVTVSMPENPFGEAEDELTQLHRLTPEQARAIMDRLDPQESKP